MIHIQDASKIFSNISPFTHIKQNNSKNSPVQKISFLKKNSMLDSPSRKNRNKKIHEIMNYDSDNINTEINTNFYDNFLEKLQKDSNANNHQNLKFNKKVEFDQKSPTKEESFTNFSKYVSNTKISENFLKKTPN